MTKEIQTSKNEELFNEEELKNPQTEETLFEETEGESQTPEKTPSSEEVAPSSDEVERLKKKLSASSREALRLLEENKKLKEQLAELSQKVSPATPASEILAKELPDWELYSDDQRELLVKVFELSRLEALKTVQSLPEFKIARELYEKTKWQEEFEEVVKDYPELKEKEAEFKEFAYQPENREVSLSLLAEAFLFKQAEERGMKKEAEKLARKGLERPTGGSKEIIEEMTEEDWLRLAQTNPSEFKKRGKEFEAWLNRQLKKSLR